MCVKDDEVTSVLIVEDHPIFREAVRGYLETQPAQFQIIGDVGSKAEGLQLVQDQVPDIVLLDLGLPERTEDGIEEGLEAIQEIRSLSPTTQVVVLTAHVKTDVVFQAIRAGAVSYLLKDVTGQDLLDNLRRVQAGDPPIDAKVARKLWEYYENPEAAGQTPYDKLTRRELDVLRLIAEGLTNSEITEDLNIAMGTVKKHVSNILAKLQLDNRVELMIHYRTNYSNLKE